LTISVDQELGKLATELLVQMREGADTWYMPWHKGLEEPYNKVTGHVFTGGNAAILWSQAVKRGYPRSQWATLKQWASRRGKVRMGAKGVRVFAPIYRDATPTSASLRGFRSYHVFNVEEINNFNPDHPDMFPEDLVGSAVGDFAQRTGAQIRFIGDTACYRPRDDVIDMPPRNHFIDTPHTTAEEGFQSTLVHELVHWTKNDKRANRKPLFEDRDLAYAFEELVAELGAAMICTRFAQRIEPRPDHAAYLKSWLTALEHDFSHFYKAMSLAQSATRWLYLKTEMVPPGWVFGNESQIAAADTEEFFEIAPGLIS
jgi:antirestriction protein ArdC